MADVLVLVVAQFDHSAFVVDIHHELFLLHKFVLRVPHAFDRLLTRAAARDAVVAADRRRHRILAVKFPQRAVDRPRRAAHVGAAAQHFDAQPCLLRRRRFGGGGGGGGGRLRRVGRRGEGRGLGGVGGAGAGAAARVAARTAEGEGRRRRRLVRGRRAAEEAARRRRRCCRRRRRSAAEAAGGIASAEAASSAGNGATAGAI